jgi:hypothetical protein
MTKKPSGAAMAGRMIFFYALSPIIVLSALAFIASMLV